MEVESTPTAVRWRRVLIYYFAVFAFSYGLVGAFFASGGSFHDSSWVMFAQISALSPALIAIALTRWLWREPVVASLALRPRRNRWLLFAWLAPWALILLALVLGLAVPGVHWDATLQPAVDATLISPEQLATLHEVAAKTSLPPVLLLVPMGILLSFTLSFVAGCGEEIGWRGFVHGELRPLGFWRNALLTGVLWLGWHLPLLALGYAFPKNPGLGAVLLSTQCLISSIVLAYVRERAQSSLAAGLFHGTTEAAMLLAIAPLAGGSELTVGMASLSWIGADLVIVIAVLAYDHFIAREPIAWPRRDRGPAPTPPAA